MGAVARQVSNLPPVYVRGNLIHSDHLEHSTMMMMRVMMMMMRVMVMMMVVIVMTNPHLQNHNKYAQKRQFYSIFLQTLMMTFELEIFCNFLQDLSTTRQNKIYKHVCDWSKILARVGF